MSLTKKQFSILTLLESDRRGRSQRDIANAVKRARTMALMPYAVPAVSGRGDRRRNRD